MDINKIKNLLQSISHWPWKSSFQCNNSWLVYGPKIPYEGSDGFLEEDAVFIASAPTIIDQLIKQNELMRKALIIYSKSSHQIYMGNLAHGKSGFLPDHWETITLADQTLKEVERIEDEN